MSSLRNEKLTFNGLIMALIIFSALAFFVSVKMTGMADRTAINVYSKIDGTEDLAIRYSNLEPDGIYKGSENNNELLVEGTFGYDWGCVVEGDYLYVNEYRTSDLGVLISKLVKINLKTLEKQTLYNNTVLRGKCASGELVATSDYLLPANKPETNRFCKLYNLTAASSSSEREMVLYINPENGEIVFSTPQSPGIKESFEERYLERTLEEVMK